MTSLSRIIISRTDSLGDVMLTLPLAGLCKQLYPNCEILFLGRTYTQSILSCCADVAQIITLDELQQMSLPQQISAIQNLRVDAIIHVFPNKQVAKLAKAAAIPLRIGTSHRIFHWTTCNKMVHLSRKKSLLHEAQLNLALAKPLGIGTNYTLEEIAELVHFQAKTINFDAKSLLDKQRFNLVLHPKSKGSAREWGTGNFARLIELLPVDKFNIFITGTQTEGDAVRDKLITPYPDKVTDLCGKLSLDELITFLANTDGIVAASTGPLHIAAMLGIHAIGIYPPIRPMHAGRWAPIGKNVKIFTETQACEKCRKSANCECMRKIRPEMVAEYLNTKHQ
jgi:ADP-heptose:LPS heptosyltransferase